MASSGGDKVFAGAIPKFYETYLVPLLFEPYAADLAKRLAPRSPRRVLEVAAGTRAPTRALAADLHDRASAVAAELNPPRPGPAAAPRTRCPVQGGRAGRL